jgi:hypothetical protein
VTTALAIPLTESDESSQEQQSSLSGGTIAVIIMAVLAVLGLGGVFLLHRSRKSRQPIPHPVIAAVPNSAFLINMDDRALTGNVVVTNPADQIQYLIPMVEQAPGEYLVPMTRNEDYTYAPPMQPPADYAVTDENGSSTNEAPSGGGRGGGGKKKCGGGKDLDLDGYVLDEASAPAESGGAGGNIVYSSYVEGSTGGASNAAEYGPLTESGGGNEAVYGDDPYGLVGGGSGGNQRRSAAQQGSVDTLEGMEQNAEETDI